MVGTRTAEIFLLQAIAKAWESQTLALPNPAVGALVLSPNFEILSLESHAQFGSSHAELLALKSAFLKLSGCQEDLHSLSPKALWDFLAKNHGGLFRNCSIFVTLEPCLHEGKTPSCAKLLSILKPKNLIFGSKDPTPKAQGGAAFLASLGIKVLGEICARESANLLYPFLTYIQKGRFNLFKIAQRLNGSYQEGQITGKTFQIFTHSQRSNARSLVISGNTVRCDLPKLDARFSPTPEKKPEIQILSRYKTPTDSIQSQEIKIAKQIQELELGSGFNLIEGGYPLLLSLREKIDGLLLAFAPFFFSSNSFDFLEKMEFELLYHQTFQEDLALWFKPKSLS